MAEADITNVQPVPGLSYAEAAKTNGVDDTNLNDTEPSVNGNGPTTPGEYTGEGLDAAPKSPIRGHKKVSSRSSRTSLKQTETDSVVYEKISRSNGENLTSVKPSYDYEASIELDESERPNRNNNKLQLVSGRKPSAGWEKSGYVN
jgi:2-acylglycerol O-acyltransferase 2